MRSSPKVRLYRLTTLVGGLLLGSALLFGSRPIQAAPNARAVTPRCAAIRKAFPSAVRIKVVVKGEVVLSASGIAFARDAGKTYILTNAHVVEISKEWKDPMEVHVLVDGREKPLLGRVIECGSVPDQDLALVEVADVALPLAQLAPDDELQVGDDLFVIGAPFGKGLSVAAGILSQVEYEPADAAASVRRPVRLKTDAAIGYGSSGGGVFDVEGGQLLGIVEGYRTARVTFGKQEVYAFDVPMPGETFAAPAAKIRRFLDEHGLSRLAGTEGSSLAVRKEAPPVVTAKGP